MRPTARKCPLGTQQIESHGDGRLAADAVQDGVDRPPADEAFQFVLNDLDGLVSDVDPVVRAVLRGYVEFAVRARERHHRRTASEQLRVLDPVASQSAYARDCHSAVGSELACVPQLPHASVRGHAGVCHRSKELGSLRRFLGDPDRMPVLHGHVLGETSWRAEAHPPAVTTAQLLVPFAALPARTVSPAGVDDDHVTLRVAHCRRHGAAQVRHSACDLMTGDIGEIHRERSLEVAVEELVVAAAHAHCGNLQEDLVRPDLRHRDLFDPKGFLVSVHPGCSHLHDVCLAFAGKRKCGQGRAARAGLGVRCRSPSSPASDMTMFA
jgi:hypothetical protein